MSSSNALYKNAADQYLQAANNYLGNPGYMSSYYGSKDRAADQTQTALRQGRDNAGKTTRQATSSGFSNAGSQTAGSTYSAINRGKEMNASQNEDARKYAGQQARATAAGAQSQATTAARAAGMNKAQAAMMGSQQNANAYQNAYGNAYNTQLGNAANNQNLQLQSYNNAFENNANRANNNINTQQMLANSNLTNQQQMAAQMQQALANAYGSMVSGAQAEGQNQYNRQQNGISTALSVGASLLPLLLMSDERLKHYKECSKKVVMRTPSKIQSLKFVAKTDNGDN